MKNMRLRDLKNKPDKFFRDYGIFRPDNNTTDEEIRYFVRRSYEALPKKYKKYLDIDKEREILITAHSIRADGESGKWDAYQSLVEKAKFDYKASGDQTKELLWRQFKLQTPSLYSHFNTYVYRRGFSASQWFMEHSEIEQVDQYHTYVRVELPIKTKGVIYKYLRFTFHWDAFGTGSIEDAKMDIN